MFSVTRPPNSWAIFTCVCRNSHWDWCYRGSRKRLTAVTAAAAAARCWPEQGVEVDIRLVVGNG